jgi:hypothetical protein
MTTFFVMTASSGSAFTIGQLEGDGAPVIFDGDAIYVYRMSGAIWTTRDYGETWINVVPNGLSWMTTLCQTSGSAMADVTYTTSAGATSVPSRYQTFPEITAWSSGSAIPSGNMSDSVSSTISGLPVLVGNISVANAARVWRSTTAAPYAMVKSDAGIPVTAQVTVLDIAE